MKPIWKHFIFASIMTALIFVLITGCQEPQLQESKHYVVNRVTIASALMELDKQFDTTNLTVISLMDSLSEQDFRTLALTAQELRQLRQQIHETIQASGSLSTFLINTEQLKALYLKGGDSYTQARVIIEKYWGGLPLETQSQLKEFDRQVFYLHLAIFELQNTPEGSDITQTIEDIISIGTATARLLEISGVL